MLTNKGLVEHAKMAESQKWGYVWGTFGRVLTPALFDQKLKQYPGGVGNHKDFIKKNWLNRRTSDCVGLIKSYLWWDGGNIKYDLKQDTSANGMYELSKKKGPISSLPNTPGVCVWHRGHIGVYIGNGRVIEARGTKAGVINSPLTGAGAARWTHWLECPFIVYEEPIKPKEVEKMELLLWQKEMGEKSLKSLVDKGIVNNPEAWEKTLGEPTPQYLFWTIMDRITEEGK